jgi:hypothetical protein
LVTREQNVARRSHKEAFEVAGGPEALLVREDLNGARRVGSKVAKDLQRVIGRTVVTDKQLRWQQCLFGKAVEEFLQIATSVVGVQAHGRLLQAHSVVT